MAVPASREQLKDWCLRQLGHPVIEINVDDDQVEDRIDEAFQYIQQFHFDGVERWYLKHQFTQENITNGFSRNGILAANILNLEFVFNDDSSQKYDFNRYLGLYVNAIELTKVDIDLDRAYLNRSTWENVPHFRKKFLETDDVVLSQTNEAGVIIPFKNSIINFSEFSSTFENSDNLYLNYISDKDNNLYILLLLEV
jgi:hypothetical protein